MAEVFLESHNIDNLFFGLGQFNKHLIEAIHKELLLQKNTTINITVTSKNKDVFSEALLKKCSHKTYKQIYRNPFFRIRKKYDLWHSLNQNTKIEPYYNIPYLLTIHDVNFMEELTGKALEKAKHLFETKLNRSHAITYISNYAKNMTHKYFSVPKVKEYVIYNGSAKIANKLPKNHKPKIEIGSKFLFFVGEFLEKKNIHTLIETLPYLPEYKLVLAGKNTTTYAEKCFNLIKELNLQDRVIIAGKISEEDKWYYYKNCSAFVFPSLREGFGLPPIEAMQFGKSVFLSNKSALPEVGGKLAYYWTHFEPKYMAETLISGLNRFEENKETKIEALINYANSYSWESTAKAYIEVYKNLLSK